MKTLLLLRHAKAEPEENASGDETRALTHRGQRDARKVGEWLRRQGLVPDALISSTAARARETAELAKESGAFPAPIDFHRDLYLAPPATYVDVLKTRSDVEAAILMVGHNPGIESLASLVSGDDQRMGTAAIAHLRFPIHSWIELRLEAMGTLVELWRPGDE